MAKNKGQKSKSSVLKKVSGVKKAKTKAVTTNLKKLNFHNKSKMEKADAAFKGLQTMITTTVKETKQTAPTQTKIQQKPTMSTPDVNQTATDFSKL